MSFFLCHKCANASTEVIFNLEQDGEVQSFVIEAETLKKFYGLYQREKQQTSHPIIKVAQMMFWADQQKRKKEKKGVK